jgi:hypothetical protein
MTEATQTSPAPEQGQNTDLTIQDLQMLKQIVDLASSRAAFKPGSEMIAVGQVYSKLDAFLTTVSKAQAEAQAQQPQQSAAEQATANAVAGV